MGFTKKKSEVLVINIKRDPIRGYVFIGRDYLYPTGRGKYGNPFKIIKGKRTRAESIELFKEYFHAPEQASLRAMARAELKGAILGCYCKPYDCHGDIIKEYLEGLGNETKSGSGII